MIARYFALCFACTVLSFDSASANSINRSFIEGVIADLGSTLTVQGSGVISNSAIYFAGADQEHGTELWRTDGTPEGTFLLKDVNPGAESGFPASFLAVGGLIYFQASDGVHGPELWVSDGTEPGTYLVKDIVEGAGGASPVEFESLHGRSFFRAYEPSSGWELWTSDGTAAGTYLLKDIALGAGSSFPTYLVAFQGELYFQALDEQHGSELWKTDGTPGGTALFLDIIAGPESGGPFHLNSYGATLSFRTWDANGPRLWKSDGMASGTSIVAATVPGRVQLSWQPPTQNTDNSPLVDLGGYRIRFGSSPFSLDYVVHVPDPSASSLAIDNFPPGPLWFAIASVNSSEIESALSGVVFTLIQ